MKKLFLLLLLGLFLYGCGAAGKESEFWKHDSIYKNWAHMKYSLWGYKNPTKETGKQSTAEDWWGIEVPYIPAE